jgi:hypothetical protein
LDSRQFIETFLVVVGDDHIRQESGPPARIRRIVFDMLFLSTYILVGNRTTATGRHIW